MSETLLGLRRLRKGLGEHEALRGVDLEVCGRRGRVRVQFCQSAWAWQDWQNWHNMSTARED